ncbi:glycosyltransferase family 8 protein [Ideonella sp. YS5]|uniref:glycosyltransferase family 8 protein n=1 Tax=Ideonella sp. YS5 TaxID=3453714 RepID=UPI003EF00647
MAHAAMDGECVPGWGAASAAAVACAEGFHELARVLLDRADPDAACERLWPLRLEVALAQGGDAAGALAQSRRADVPVAWATLEPLWRHAVDYARVDVLEALQPLAESHAPQSTPALKAAESLRQDLGRLEFTRAAGDRAHAVAVTALPPFGLQGAGRASGPAVRLARELADGAAGGRWFRWRSPQGPTFATLVAAKGHTDSVADELVVLADGLLDGLSRPHWGEALKAWDRVLVVGLHVRDPAALDEETVAALRRHQPLGARDVVSWWLLRERGVDAYLSGPASSTAISAEPRQRLWTDSGGCAPGMVVSALAAALREGQSDVQGMREELRRRCAPHEPPSPATLTPWPAGLRADETAAAIRARANLGAPGPGTDEEIQVALAVDDRLFHALPVVIDSCLDSGSLPFRFHVLSRGLSQEDWASCRASFKGRARIDFYPFDDADYGERLHLISHTTVSTLDRLLLPELLPNLDRVLYLDVDLVVVGDIAPLWRMDLRGHPLAAKPSSSPGTRFGVQMLYHALGHQPWEEAQRVRHWLHGQGPMTFRAFNAGVLVMDLDRMRAEGATAFMLALVAHAAMNDQDALNAYARDRYVALESRWNAAPRQDDTADARIIHFVGPVKPWHAVYISRKPEFERARARISGLQRLDDAA